MQDLKADAVRFLTRDESKDPGRDRDAGKLLARCDIDVRHLSGQSGVDVLIRGPHEVIDRIKSSEKAGRIENAVREACESGVRMLQWVEAAEADTARPGSGAGDGSGPSGEIQKGGKQPAPRFDSQRHGSGQSPEQPVDRSIAPGPNPRR